MEPMNRYDRMQMLELARVTPDVGDLIDKADKLVTWAGTGTKPGAAPEASVTIVEKDATDQFGGYPDPATLTDLPSMGTAPTSNVVDFPEPLPVNEPAPKKERKARGPNKVKAVKAAKGKRGRPRKETSVSADTATVSEVEKDSRIANGSGEHVEMPAAEPASEQPMAA